ncbi:MAG TPA: glycerol acyltransferase [Bacteroidales bacterium]|nr:glycerol acyltransferase [Bacteroidales bacterium]
MIKASHHPLIYPFFLWYSRRLIRRHFDRVNVVGDAFPTNGAILLLANHISWWDGFWVAYLNKKHFGRLFHVMMTEEQLQKYPYFSRCGAFSIRKGHRSQVESLDYAARLLEDPANLLLFFPQGVIHSLYQAPMHFEKGVERVLTKAATTDCQVVFLLSLPDYLATKKPSLTLYYERYTGPYDNLDQVEAAYQAFQSRCLTRQSLLVV